jgi:hypothetical protein
MKRNSILLWLLLSALCFMGDGLDSNVTDANYVPSVLAEKANSSLDATKNSIGHNPSCYIATLTLYIAALL